MDDKHLKKCLSTSTANEGKVEPPIRLEKT